MRGSPISRVCIVIFIAQASCSRASEHSTGTCSTLGICGHREDGDVLSCAETRPAPSMNSTGLSKLQLVCPQLAAERGSDPHFCCTEQQLDTIQSQIQIANIFLLGCPACSHNFKHLFCLLECHPDQATFTNVTATQAAHDTGVTSVANVSYYVTPHFGQALFDSCKDVTYPVLNQKAMKFVGGGAQTYQEWLDFIGTVKDARFPPTGSPFQMDFPPLGELPERMRALNASLASCCEGPLACSCGDCPGAKGCKPPPPPPPAEHSRCSVPGFLPGLRCVDLGWALLALLAAVVIPLLVRRRCARHDPSGEGMPDLPPGYASAFEGAKRGGLASDGELLDYPSTETFLRRAFFDLGELCARRPGLILAATVTAAGLAALGLLALRIESDPERLWVGPGSQAAREQADYEASFGPFYRISQLILSTGEGGGPITTDSHLRTLFAMHELVDQLAAPYGEEAGAAGNATLSSVCFKPLGAECAIQSVAQYWQLSVDVYEHGSPPMMVPVTPEFCYGHWNTQCLSAYGAPIDPHVVLGGFPTAAAEFRNFSADATAFVVTFLLDPAPALRPAAEAWEAAFTTLAHTRLRSMAEEAGLRLSFSAQRSVADEISREGWADAWTVVASYAAMLAYIAAAMGTFPRGQPRLLHSRIGLGLAGVSCVAASVAAALGLFGWAGTPATLIVMEVIPFLALAVGVDNMFILASALERQPRSRPLPQRAGLALAAVGPSILLAATCEVVAFALGGMTTMPALRSFALCAALAVALDFGLQVTAFMAVLVLDDARIEAGRADCLPWIRLKDTGSRAPLFGSEELEAEEEEGAEAETRLLSASGPGFSQDDDLGEASWGERSVTGALRALIRDRLVPALRRPAVKSGVLVTFTVFFILSLAALPRLERGLEQSTALPADSYLQDYFADVAGLLRVGPPLILVVEGLDLTQHAHDNVTAICSVSGCDPDSLLNEVSRAALAPWQSFLAAPAASWLDDFITWLSPDAPLCCRQHGGDLGGGILGLGPNPDPAYCPPPDQEPCASDPTACADCRPCLGPGELSDGRPTLAQFQARLPWFLAAKPSAACAKGGAGAYDAALRRSASDATAVAGLSRGRVDASAFRTSYVSLSRQADFIQALQASRGFAEEQSRALGLPVYAYSIFHVFFEQYLTIAGEAATILGIAATAVFVICLAMTGSPVAACLVLLTLASMVVDLLGLMTLTGIQLNAVSVVNLVAALGIGVEFCAHLLHAFMEESGDREQRTAAALTHVGAAVLAGITLTKFVGVAVLAFARTQIFRVYFFRMYLALVLVGAAHGLILLPVLLSLLGPSAWDRWELCPAPSGRWRGSLGAALPSELFRDEEEEGVGASLAAQGSAGARSGRG
ncbi:SSD3 [Auxenochlorella protothecoides x Auxenochlorella symbiontica]